MAWRFDNGGFVEVPDEVPPELSSVLGSPGSILPPAGVTPATTIEEYLANPERGFKAPEKSVDELYALATEKPPLPLTDAVVKPPAPPVVPTPVMAAPAPAPVEPPVETPDPVQELQGLLDTLQPKPEFNKEAPPSVTNMDQGIVPTLDNAPPVPISQDNIDIATIPLSGIIEPPPPAPAQPSFIERLMTETQNQGRQLLSGAVGNVTSAPMNAGAAIAALAELGTQAGIFPEGPKQLAENLLGESQRMQQGADFMTGANPKPQTPGQTLARTIGKNANPSAPITGLLTGADIASQMLAPTPAMGMDKATAEKILFPKGNPNQPTAGPRVTHTVPTAGGPARVSDGDMRLLGYMGAASLGAMFAPSVISRIQSTILPVSSECHTDRCFGIDEQPSRSLDRP